MEEHEKPTFTMVKNLIPRLAEVGKIKIGGKGEKRKKQGSNEYYRLPVKDDKFTITTLEKDGNDDFVKDEATMQIIGELTGQDPNNLKRLPIRLLYDSPVLNFPTCYACYKGTTCWCRGNGELAERHDVVGELPKLVTCPCERQNPEYNKPDKCKLTGTLSVVLEGIPKFGGVWKFRTTSYNSVTNILSSLALFYTNNLGILADIPLSLEITPKTVSIPGQKKTTKIYMVFLTFDGAKQKMKALAYDEGKHREQFGVKMKEIEAGAHLYNTPETEEEALDFSEEYYPDPGDDAAAENIRNAIRPETEAPDGVDPETGEITNPEEPEGPTAEESARALEDSARAFQRYSDEVKKIQPRWA